MDLTTPLTRIVYLNNILSYAADNIVELVRKTLVNTNWLECVYKFCSFSWRHFAYQSEVLIANRGHKFKFRVTFVHYYPLHYAVRKNCLSALRALLIAGQTWTHKWRNNMTMFDHIIEDNNTSAAAILLEYHPTAHTQISN